MADLFKEYFERDLSEAEEDLIKQRISESPDEAMAFSRAAAVDYAASGLPSPFKLALAWKIAGAGLLLALVGGGAYTLGLKKAPPQIQPVRVGDLPAPSASAPAAQAPRPLAKARDSISTTRQASGVPTPAAPAVPEADQVSVRASGQGFEMVLATQQPGQARVLVLDRAGTLQQQLYQGRLDAGRWRFEWNGHNRQGVSAGPGIYRIEIHRPQGVTRRLVEIESR